MLDLTSLISLVMGASWVCRRCAIPARVAGGAACEGVVGSWVWSVLVVLLSGTKVGEARL